MYPIIPTKIRVCIFVEVIR